MMPTTPSGSRVTSMSTFGPHAREFLARNPQRFASEEVEDLAGPGRLADPFRQRLALLAREQAPELLAAGEDLGRNLEQDVVALLRRGARPGGKGRMRGLDRGAGLGGVGLGVFADEVVGVRGVDVAGDGRSVDPFSGNEVLVQSPMLLFPELSYQTSGAEALKSSPAWRDCA